MGGFISFLSVGGEREDAGVVSELKGYNSLTPWLLLLVCSTMSKKTHAGDFDALPLVFCWGWHKATWNQ
jgi:hypothetical protein